MCSNIKAIFGLNIFYFIYMKGIGQSTDVMLKPYIRRLSEYNAIVTYIGWIHTISISFKYNVIQKQFILHFYDFFVEYILPLFICYVTDFLILPLYLLVYENSNLPFDLPLRSSIIPPHLISLSHHHTHCLTITLLVYHMCIVILPHMFCVV